MLKIERMSCGLYGVDDECNGNEVCKMFWTFFISVWILKLKDDSLMLQSYTEWRFG